MARTPLRPLLAALGGGSVNTATGDFVFGVTEAYLIEDGEITEPLREANLIGNGPEVLRAIDAVGNDFDIGPARAARTARGAGSAGQPTVRVREMTVGGTAGADAGDLLVLARQVAGAAKPGEQVEAYVASSLAPR